MCQLYLFASFLSFVRNCSTFARVLHPHWWTWVCAFIFYCLNFPSLMSFLLQSVIQNALGNTLLFQWFDCTCLGIFLNNVFVHSKFWTFTTNDVLCPYTKFDILASWRLPFFYPHSPIYVWLLWLTKFISKCFIYSNISLKLPSLSQIRMLELLSPPDFFF